MLNRLQSDSELLKKIGARVRYYRKRLELSVQELHFVSGVPVDVICALEMQALGDIDVLTIANLGAALMVDLVSADEDVSDWHKSVVERRLEE